MSNCACIGPPGNCPCIHRSFYQFAPVPRWNPTDFGCIAGSEPWQTSPRQSDGLIMVDTDDRERMNGLRAFGTGLSQAHLRKLSRQLVNHRFSVTYALPPAG